MGKRINRLKEEYEKSYSHLPDSHEDLLEYIKGHYKINENKLTDDIQRIESIKWKTISFTLPLVPSPSPRPRSTSDGHFYVKGAAEHKQFVRNLIRTENIIFTICKVDINIYQPTPASSMTNNEIYLAELGLIRPVSGGDWDNFAKTYCDAVQDIIIINDNIIYKGTCERFYSLKPKVEITFSYQDNFDSNFNKRKIVKSKSYANAVEGGLIHAEEGKI